MNVKKPTLICISDINEISVINTSEIIYCKSHGSYTEMYFSNSTKLISKRLKKVEMMLPEKDFFRIHHFYVINFSHMKFIKRSAGKMRIELSNGDELPVSRRKTAQFNSVFKNK